MLLYRTILHGMASTHQKVESYDHLPNRQGLACAVEERKGLWHGQCMSEAVIQHILSLRQYANLEKIQMKCFLWLACYICRVWSRNGNSSVMDQYIKALLG